MSVNPRVSEITILGTQDKAGNNQNNNATIATITNVNGTFYYHRDHQGSIIALTNSSGAVVESFTYDNHYGTITKHTKTTETNNPYGYTGRELDTEELYYYRARYYDPMLQRFISEDPIRFSSGDFNFYGYVGGSPVNKIDSRGLWDSWVGGGRVKVNSKCSLSIISIRMTSVGQSIYYGTTPWNVDIDFVFYNGKWYKLQWHTVDFDESCNMNNDYNREANQIEINSCNIILNNLPNI